MATKKIPAKKKAAAGRKAPARKKAAVPKKAKAAARTAVAARTGAASGKNTTSRPGSANKSDPESDISNILSKASKVLDHPLLRAGRQTAAPPPLFVAFCRTQGIPLGDPTTDEDAAWVTAKAHARATGDNVTVIPSK